MPGAGQVLPPAGGATPSSAAEVRPPSHPDVSTPLPAGGGRRLGAGRFELRRPLGKGGFGTTYVAFDHRLQRDCVIKLEEVQFVHAELAEELHRRFANEVLALARLSHPNVVQVFDYGEEPGGGAWIAMEYVEGRPLSAVLRAEGRLDCSRVARLGAQIAAALAAAHARGIVHRDLKPDNVVVLLDGSGTETAKVLDFGIARFTDAALDPSSANMTVAGAILGTPAYMSPEQARGEGVGPASDLYSLGVVLYQAATGTLPGRVPQTWTPVSTLNYVEGEPGRVRQLRADCPPVLAEAIEALLVKDARGRVCEAGAVQARLEAAAGGQAPPARTGPRPSAPRLQMVLVAFAGAIAALAGALLGLHGTGSLQVPEDGRGWLETVPPGPLSPSGRHLWLSDSATARRPAPAALPSDDPAATADGGPVDRDREERIEALLRRARSGAGVSAIDAAALELAAGGSDARLTLARGLARRLARDYEGSLPLLEEAARDGVGTLAGREARALREETWLLREEAVRAARRAAPPAAPPPEARGGGRPLY